MKMTNLRLPCWMAAGMMACAVLFSSPAAAEEMEEVQEAEEWQAPVVDEKIFQWVQSTARQNYYFNKRQMHYGITDGKADPNILIVPTLRTYDDVQIEDVVAKRRWKMEDLDGYDRLAGAAEYLKIDRAAGTVTIEEHDDLDDTWATIREESEPVVIEMGKLSEKDVDGCFFRAILKYADKHAARLLKRTEAKIADGAE